ncbi:MAG TPA: cytochrome c [Verrucomicrobiae bacterium]|jgi:mono/diheme cytochrome c family protein|nr:cytochrome c [Verrucomicrobiae bacterium]
MRRSLLKWLLLTSAAAVLALPLMCTAQLTMQDIDTRLNMESHIGNITGHANSAVVKYDYRRYCVGCHGEHGDGNGEVAQWLDPPMWPKPRDFQLGIFKCRSTPTGTLPTDEDLYDTIARGMDRSAMPQWSQFTKDQRADLVAWVKHFSPRFATEKPGTPIAIPPEPEITAERIKAGRDVFARVQCWKCHGVTGEANGPSAPTLTDDQGRPIAPFNFTEGSRPKCGDTDRDIYRIFMTGLDGTPMPSFADNIKPDEAWDLVFYLRTLMKPNSKEKEIAKQLKLQPVSSNPGQ